MSNLSKIRRDKMIEFLETLKEQHSDDESGAVYMASP